MNRRCCEEMGDAMSTSGGCDHGGGLFVEAAGEKSTA